VLHVLLHHGGLELAIGERWDAVAWHVSAV
jgi:hypothetical protein